MLAENRRIGLSAMAPVVDMGEIRSLPLLSARFNAGHKNYIRSSNAPVHALLTRLQRTGPRGERGPGCINR